MRGSPVRVRQAADTKFFEAQRDGLGVALRFLLAKRTRRQAHSFRREYSRDTAATREYSLARFMEPPPHSLDFADTAVKLLIVLAVVLVNGFFVASEFALVSLRRTRIDQMAAEGNSSAVLVQRALRELNRYIAANQVGVTVASLVLGGLGEQILEPLFVPLLTWMPQRFIGITRSGIAIGLAYLTMTTMHVVLGELIPKTLALHSAEKLALVVVRPLTLFVRLCTPLVWFLNGLAGFLLRLIGIRGGAEEGAQVHSSQELDLLFTQSHEGGEITATEREILHRVVRFSDLTAREVMVPRVEMKGVPLEMTRRELVALVEGKPHTRMPVYTDSLDDVVGIVHLKDLVQAVAELRRAAFAAAEEAARLAPQVAGNWLPSVLEGDNDAISLSPFVREVARVPETIAIDKMLIEFKKRRQQMAIVIDEYGGTSGLLTMGDLLEQVFGNVRDEFDRPEPDIIEHADGRVRLPGKTLIDDVNERYGVGFRTEDSDTIAGLILDVLGRPADVGDEVEINGVLLRVEEVDRLRITAISLQFETDKNGDEASATARS
jgi:CBS domain containing-hemolysin-like protein